MVTELTSQEMRDGDVKKLEFTEKKEFE